MASNKQNSFFNWLMPKRTDSITPQSPSFMYVGGTTTRTGEAITPENALRNPTVYSCVSAISQTISPLPWSVVDKNSVGFTPVKHKINDLLERPNAGMTPFELKHQMVVDLLTYGNCFLLKIVTSSGRVVELIPLRADEVTPILSVSGKRSYRLENGTVYSAEQVIHIRDFVVNSIDGLSKVNQCANLVAIDNAIDDTLADNFRNGTAISGVVSFPEAIPPEVKKAFGDAWAEKFSGRGSSRGSVAVVDQGATFTQANPLSPADGDLRELKQQTMTRIAAVFRVPAYAIEISDGSKYDNLSQRQAGFYRDSIAPIVKNIQQKFTAALLDDPSLEIKFDSTELVKGDLQSTTDIAVKGIESGIIDRNEARDLMGYAEKEQEVAEQNGNTE